MSAPHDEDELAPTMTPGYKPGAEKTVEELAKLDAEDESLARWKASLGIMPGSSGSVESGPKLTVLTLELMSPTMPAGMKLSMDVTNPAALQSLKENPFKIKEGVPYNVRMTFKVNHGIVSGVRYIQVAKRAVFKEKMEQMLGSYGAGSNIYTKDFPEEESPSGMVARSGSFTVRSRVVDDDGKSYAGAQRWSPRTPLGVRSVTSQPSTNTPTPVVSPTTWIDRAPAKLRPYLYLTRIDKPIGTLLLMYPCSQFLIRALYCQMPHTECGSVLLAWSITMASLFGLGALIMRSAGCTINDMADKDFDKAVDRTKDRPIARGDITRTQAFGFLGLQLTGGLAVLTQLNWYSILLGAASLPIVALYPFMKRYTYWPQSVLGTSSLLYFGLHSITHTYLTQFQDKTDDIKVGVRSTALLFGTHTRLTLSAFATSATSLFALAGVLNAHGLPYFAGTALAGLQLARVLRRTDFDDRASCWDGFRGCGWAGAWLWAGAAADYALLLAGVQVPSLW
ncbi:hypothetical protein EIP86_001837 [Pleurotus ostreatoroseus]|nr:hypothetical protein EIP86_001837 [Pleurotus ostreatoroseus]